MNVPAAAAIVVLSLLLAGCGNPESMTLGGVTLVRHGPLAGGPTAALRGTLKFEVGCAWIVDSSPGGFRYVGLWPADTELRHTTGGRLSISSGGRQFIDGDQITVVGGESKDTDSVREQVGELPTWCITDRYWLVTEIDS